VATRTAPSRDEAYALLEHELAVLLRRARGTSGSLAREVHPDLDAAAYGLLARIEDEGRVRVTDLATYFGVGKPTVSRQITLLERLDLVARAANDEDARSRYVTLTPEGRERVRRARSARRVRMQSQVASWPPEDVATFAALLHRYNDTA
jgi:DNA-binding MarR family transcriptional regulator